MSITYDLTSRLLTEGGFASAPVTLPDAECLRFEGPTVLGFAIVYPRPASLLARWEHDTRAVITEYQFALKRAQSKAWNTYVILLAAATATEREQVALRAVEEDLIGTRKIASAGNDNIETIRRALLPLLQIQTAPHLEAVDMKDEIRIRTSALPAEAVGAFLSEATVGQVAQLLEEP